MGGLLGGQSGGGVSPGQMSLANFTLGQNLLNTSGQFAGTNTAEGGLSNSTMHAMGSAGDYMKWVQDLSGMSQADTAANNAAQAQQKASLGSTVGGLGSLFGGSSGGFGGTGGSFG